MFPSIDPAGPGQKLSEAGGEGDFPAAGAFDEEFLHLAVAGPETRFACGSGGGLTEAGAGEGEVTQEGAAVESEGVDGVIRNEGE